MVIACSSFARCSWRRWWNKIVLCQLLPSWNIPHNPMECSSSPSAARCSSLWATKAFKAWYPTVGHTLVKFDQCRLGQSVPKATSISSDLAIQCWDGLRCNHPPHKLPEDMQSSDLSRYPPPMMHLLRTRHTNTQVPEMSCLSDSKWGLWIMAWIVQPLCLLHTVSHLWTSMWLSNWVSEPDPSEMGVGNLLQGDWFRHYGRVQGSHPWDTNHWHHVRTQSSGTNVYFLCGEKNHPFSEDILRRIRQCLGATPEDGVAEGQPFFLISRLAKASIQIGDTHSHSRRGCQLGWMNLLSGSVAHEGRIQRNSRWLGRPPAATTMTQPKSSQTPSRRRSLKKKKWAWWKALSPNRRQRIDVGVSLVNFVLGPWRPLMKETKLAPYMMVALVGKRPHPAE